MKPVLDPKVFLAALALFAGPGCGGDDEESCDSADEQCGDGTQEGGSTPSPTAEN